MDTIMLETLNDLIYRYISTGISDEEYAQLEELKRLAEESENVFTCSYCHRYFSSSETNSVEVDGHIYCSQCIDEYFVYCTECGDLVYEEDVILDAHGNPYCPSCTDNLYRCDECGDLFEEFEVYYDESGGCLCTHCYNEYYYTCQDCGEFVHVDYAYRVDDEFYCENCYKNIKVIKDYYYKPDPIFYGCGNRYLGIELEVDRGGESHSTARDVIDILDDFVYCKHDGSLDYGFEIVSYPATLDYHMNNVDWERALQYLRDEGYESHDAGTCGLHIHMNRDGFGETEEEQESGIAKVLFFFERHWANIVKFSRRTPEQLDEWASRYLSITPKHPVDVLEYAKSDMSRYRCVNLCNHSTVEVRVFRGSLIYETFMATLQFCDLLYDIAAMPLEAVMDITWNQFKEMGSRYKEFTSYIKRRGL